MGRTLWNGATAKGMGAGNLKHPLLLDRETNPAAFGSRRMSIREPRRRSRASRETDGDPKGFVVRFFAHIGHIHRRSATPKRMVYAQLYHRSTGYNRVNKDFNGPVEAIPMVGSDGYVRLDARLAFRNLHAATRTRIEKHIRKDEIIGYQLIRASNLREDGYKLTGVIQIVKPALPFGVD